MIAALASALTGGALGALVSIRRYGFPPRSPAATGQAASVEPSEQP